MIKIWEKGSYDKIFYILALSNITFPSSYFYSSSINLCFIQLINKGLGQLPEMPKYFCPNALYITNRDTRVNLKCSLDRSPGKSPKIIFNTLKEEIPTATNKSEICPIESVSVSQNIKVIALFPESFEEKYKERHVISRQINPSNSLYWINQQITVRKYCLLVTFSLIKFYGMFESKSYWLGIQTRVRRQCI